jgi:DNA polymerase-3 subunit epsilon
VDMGLTEKLTLEEAAALLERSTDFRVLRRLKPRAEFNSHLMGETLIGIVLDVETTGLDLDVDDVIELAMTKFTFTREGEIGRLIESFHSFNEPTGNIPEEITKLTGIRDSDVSGKRISSVDVEHFASDSALIIAHNAGFDRPFSERLVPKFADYAWGCSATEIPWRDEGINGSRLEYIAQSYNFFYDAHRASDDCAVLLNILSFSLFRSKRLALSVLLENARKVLTRLFAEGASYEMRVLLKRRGYRWNDGFNGYPRAWWRDLDPQAVDAEIAFLKNANSRITPTAFKMSAKNRFRRGI